MAVFTIAGLTLKEAVRRRTLLSALFAVMLAGGAISSEIERGLLAIEALERLNKRGRYE